jgi:hypothetical protein
MASAAAASRNPRRHAGWAYSVRFFTSTCRAPIKVAPVELRVPIDGRANLGDGARPVDGSDCAYVCCRLPPVENTMRMWITYDVAFVGPVRSCFGCDLRPWRGPDERTPCMTHLENLLIDILSLVLAALVSALRLRLFACCTSITPACYKLKLI